MKHLKTFFAFMLMAVLSIGQMWGAIDANSTWTATAFGDIPDGATVIIINNFGKSLANATVTKAPAKVAASFNSTTKKITVSTTGKSLDDIAWTVEKSTNGTKFWVYGSTTNLLGVTKDGDNNAVGVGSTTSVPNNELVLSGLLKPYNLTRFIGEYVSGSDWRSYNSATANNYKSGSTTQSLTFYVLNAASACASEITITKASNPANGTFTLDQSGKVCIDGGNATVNVTASPSTGYHLASVTSTVGSVGTISNNACAITGINANTTISVTFEADPAYTVSFNVGGSTATVNSRTETSAGAGITLPTGPTPTCTGWTFAGWAAAAVEEETTTAPTLFDANTNYKPTSNCTLYAVYSRSEGTSESWNKVTSAPSDWTGDYVLESSGYAMTSDFEATGEFKGAGVTITDGKVVSPTDKMIWTFAKNGENAQYSLKNKSTGTYANITGTSSKNAGLSESAVWFTLSYSSANVWQINSVTNSTRCFAYYQNNFRTYANSTASNGVNLYKKSGGMTYYYLSTPTCTPPAVADPVISLAEGEYEGVQSGVTITCTTTDATIYYTTDGTDPTNKSSVYSSALSVSASQTIKAIAIKDNVSSEIVSAVYTIVTTCEAPTFSLAEGSYEGTQSVEISCTRTGVTIYYTTDGSNPAESATKIEYTGAISVSASQTIKAVATKANLTNSTIASATYTITAGPDVVLDFTDNTEWQFPTEKAQGSEEYTSGSYTITVFGPSVSKEGYNFYTSGGSNKLLLGKTGAYIVLPEFAQPIEKIICPGVDGASGNVTWNVFDGEDAVSTAATGCTSATTFEIENPEANKSYTIKVTSSANLQISKIKIYFGAAPAVKKPTITGNATFVGSQNVTISCETDGAAIYYTTTESAKATPATSGDWAAYDKDNKPSISATTTVWAAAKLGNDWSAVAEKTFTKITPKTTAAELREFATSSDQTAFIQLDGWKVTFVNGNNAYLVDPSNEGVVLNNASHGYTAGDELNNEVVEATIMLNSGRVQLTGFTSTNITATAGTVSPAEITDYSTLTSAHQSRLVTLKNATYASSAGTFSDGTNVIYYYDQFSANPTLVDGTTYDVTGIVIYYKNNTNDKIQIAPRTAEDVVAQSEVVIPTAANLAALKAATRGTYILTLTNAVVTYVNGNNAFIEDATGGALIFFANHGYSAGDCLNGDYQVTTTDYQGKFEITAMEPQTGAATTTAEIPLTTVSIATLNANFSSYESRRVKIAGANVTDAISGSDRNGAISDGEALAVYAAAGASTITLTADKNVDIIGYPGFYNTNQQLNVWAQADITINESEEPEKVATPTFSPTAGEFDAAQNVTISCGTSDATIYYTIDGSDPTDESSVYSSAIAVLETTTIKAFAIKDGMTNSDIASATYTITTGGGEDPDNTVTFNYTDYKDEGTTSTGSEYTMVKTDLVSIGNTKFFGNNNQAHFYANGVTTVTPASGVTIKEIVINTTSTSYNGYQSNGTITASVGSIAADSEDAKIVRWTGSADAAFTLSNDKQIRWTTIVVTYETADPSTPTLAVNPNVIDFGDIEQGESVTAKKVAVNFANLSGEVTCSGLSSPFSASGSISTTGDEITISADATVAVGEYEQTLTISSNADSKSATVTVTMNVVAAASGDVYSKLTSSIEEGDYVIFYDGKALKNTIASNRFEYAEVTPVNNKISNPDPSIVWTISQSGDYWTLYNENVSKYAGATGSNNQGALLTDAGDKALWSISGTGEFDITNKYQANNSKNAYLRNNGTYGFACYAESTGGKLILYKAVNSKVPAGLEWSASAVELTVGETFTAPTLTNPNNLTVTIESNNTELATVTNGVVSLVENATGTAKISASYAGDDTYRAASVSYTITVSEEVVPPTPQPDAVAKVIVVAYDGKFYAMSTTIKNSTGFEPVEVKKEGGKIIVKTDAEAAAIQWQMAVGESVATFQNGDNKYLACGSNSNTELALLDAQSEWEWDADANCYKQPGKDEKGRTFYYNYNSGSPIFRAYTVNGIGAENYSGAPEFIDAANIEVRLQYETVRTDLVVNRNYTICLPKKIVAVKGASFWGLQHRNAASTEVYLEEAELPYEAGTPFIFVATSTTLEVSYEGEATTTAGANGALLGTLDGLTSSDLSTLQAGGKDIYMLYNNQLRPLGANNHLDANRAYVDFNALTVDNPQSAPGRRVRAMPMAGNAATEIENVGVSEAPRKVMIDGQLYILRGEKLYDTTGRQVK